MCIPFSVWVKVHLLFDVDGRFLLENGWMNGIMGKYAVRRIQSPVIG